MPDAIDEIRQKLFGISLELGAILIDPSSPFRWASGYRMPIYNDSRLLLASPEARKLIADGLAWLLEHSDTGPVQNIAGVATGGIAHGLLLAEHLRLPMQYVRSSTKAHGLERLVEGLPGGTYCGASVAVVEDVISTGESSLKAVRALRKAEARIVACLVVYSYDFPGAAQAFAEQGLCCAAILSFSGLLQHLEQYRLFGEEELFLLRRWHEQPFRLKA